MKELVGRTIVREILRQQIFYDDLGDDGLTWAFSPSGTYALKVHSGSTEPRPLVIWLIVMHSIIQKLKLTFLLTFMPCSRLVKAEFVGNGQSSVGGLPD